jgi:hypothetical protein
MKPEVHNAPDFVHSDAVLLQLDSAQHAVVVQAQAFLFILQAQRLARELEKQPVIVQKIKNKGTLMKQYIFYILLLSSTLTFTADDQRCWQTPSDQMGAILMPEKSTDKRSPEQKALADFKDTRCKRQAGGALFTAASCYLYWAATQRINEQLTPWAPDAPVLPELVDPELEAVQCASWLGIIAGVFITADQCCSRPSKEEIQRAWTIVKES